MRKRISKRCCFVLTAGAIAPAILSANVAIADTIIRRVDSDSQASSPDGLSWPTAFQDLQDGLDAAALWLSEHEDDLVELWVAAGTYKPSVPTDCSAAPGTLRCAHFLLLKNVHIYGGFAGNETSADQRDHEENVCILSGAIGGVAEADMFHVVIAEDNDITPQNCVLDGFTIRDGFSLGAEPGFENGGAFCIFNGASPRIDRCTIINNAGLEGGAIWLDNSQTCQDAKKAARPRRRAGSNSHSPAVVRATMIAAITIKPPPSA